MAAAAGRLDTQPVAGRQPTRRLAGQRPLVEPVGTGRTILAAVGPARRMAPTLGDQREVDRLERLELAHDPVAAALATRATGAAPHGGAYDAQRKGALERLDRRVERVAHRHVDGARAGCIRAGALTAPDRLVVAEPLVAECQVVHRALALRPPERG